MLVNYMIISCFYKQEIIFVFKTRFLQYKNHKITHGRDMDQENEESTIFLAQLHPKVFYVSIYSLYAEVKQE